MGGTPCHLGTKAGQRCLSGRPNFPRREVFIMFELLELILASPIGVFILAGLQDVLYAVIVASDCDECGFNDLGKLLFGGVLAAILAGVIISVLIRRLKDKTPSASEFVSIRAP